MANLLKTEIDRLNLWDREFILKRNQFLVTRFEVCKHLFYINEGAVRAFYSREKDDISIRFGYQGSFITSITSLLQGIPTDLEISAIRSSKIQSVSREKLLKAVETDTKMAETYRLVLESLLTDYIEREQDILTDSPRERYERVLLRSPRVFQEIPHKYIASYLRMTPETLSRLRNS